RRGFPGRVPVGVLALAVVGDERVVARAGGVDGEDIARSSVAEAVEHEAHMVLVLKRRVTLARVGDHGDAGRVIHANAEHERVGGNEESHDGAAGGLPILAWFHLAEVGRGVCLCPRRLVEAPVHADLRRRHGRPEGRSVAFRVRRDERQEGEPELHWRETYVRARSPRGARTVLLAVTCRELPDYGFGW